MEQPTMVRIHECAEGHRRHVGDILFLELMKHAAEGFSALQVEQLRNDLVVLGRARVGGLGGRWSEYEIVPDRTTETENGYARS